MLLPNDTDNYYRQRNIIPGQLQDELGQNKIIITNYHAFQLREKVAAGKITKSILADSQPSLFIETPDEMVCRVCRELSTKKNIIVLNDEAHHCYRRKPDSEDKTLAGDDCIEAKNRDEEARVWRVFQTGGYAAFSSICLSCFGLRIVFHYGPAYPMENASALPSPRFEMLSICRCLD